MSVKTDKTNSNKRNTQMDLLALGITFFAAATLFITLPNIPQTHLGLDSNLTKIIGLTFIALGILDSLAALLFFRTKRK